MIQGDVTEYADVESVVRSAKKSIAGVIQASLVLKVCIIAIAAVGYVSYDYFGAHALIVAGCTIVINDIRRVEGRSHTEDKRDVEST